MRKNSQQGLLPGTPALPVVKSAPSGGTAYSPRFSMFVREFISGNEPTSTQDSTVKCSGCVYKMHSTLE